MSDTSAVPQKPLIVVDMDDVLSQTNIATVQWHNETYGTSMHIDDYHYFHYWKNEHWGTPDEVMEKLKVFFSSRTYMAECPPVPYACEGLVALKCLGYRLKIVTARHHSQRAFSEQWIETYFPGVFEEIIFTAAFPNPGDDKHPVNPWEGKSKAEVMQAIGAVLLIDDSAENAFVCAQSNPPIPVLLFGEYSWNKRASYAKTDYDRMSWAERVAAGYHGYWEHEGVIESLPASIMRVRGWKEVVDWIHRYGEWHKEGDEVEGMVEGRAISVGVRA